MTQGCSFFSLRLCAFAGTFRNTMTTPIPPEWRTHAEVTDYRETPNYADTIEYARRLADASPAILCCVIDAQDFNRLRVDGSSWRYGKLAGVLAHGHHT